MHTATASSQPAITSKRSRNKHTKIERNTHKKIETEHIRTKETTHTRKVDKALQITTLKTTKIQLRTRQTRTTIKITPPTEDRWQH